MKQAFIDINFKTKTLHLINKCNQIIGEMQAMGYTLTLRQLYYRLVDAKEIRNSVQSYGRLGYTVDMARRAGLIDWNAIEDRTRSLLRIEDWSNPIDFLERMIRRYAENLWRDQPVYCEVWIEKQALINVVERPCNEFRVPYFACRGYPSSSELYVAAKRLRKKYALGKRVVIFYLGDHDPSGLDMDRSNEELLSLFGASFVEFRRLGLTFDQTQEYDLAPDPAKQTDSRFEAYSIEYGEESWELDALRPQIIDQLIRDAIESVIDFEDFNRKLEQEKQERTNLSSISESFDDAIRYLTLRDKSTFIDTEGISGEFYTADDILNLVVAENDDTKE